MKIDPEAQEVEAGTYIAWHYTRHGGCSRPESRLVKITDLDSLKKHVAEAWAKQRQEENSLMGEPTITAADVADDLVISIKYRTHAQVGDIFATDGVRTDDNEDWYLLVKVEEDKDELTVMEHISTAWLQDPDDIPMSEDARSFYLSAAYQDKWEQGTSYYHEVEEYRVLVDVDVPHCNRNWFLFNRDAVNEAEKIQAVVRYFE